MLYGAMNTAVHPETKEQVPGFFIQIKNPAKSVILRLPTSQQIMDRLSQQKYLRKDLGRGRSKNEFIPNEKADLKLFAGMSIEGTLVGEPFDEAEAAMVIGKITYRDILSCEPDGNNFKIVLKHPFGDEETGPGLTEHLLKVPTIKQIAQYRRTVVDTINLPHDSQEIKQRAQPACDLYDSVVVEAKGYDPSLGTDPKAFVPPHHKTEIVLELVNAADTVNDSFGPNF